MWISAEKLITYFSHLNYKIWDIEFNTASGRFRYKKKTTFYWKYTDEKSEVKMIIESGIDLTN